MQRVVHEPPRGSTLSPDLDANVTGCAGLAVPAQVRATAVPFKHALQTRQIHGRCAGKVQPFCVAPQVLVASPYTLLTQDTVTVQYLLQCDRPTTG